MACNDDFLAWFLGPRGENADYFERQLLKLVRDHTHWRRNYFPGDELLISKDLKRANIASYDRLENLLAELSAGLRRNFPFFSPRYIGHQLSDVTLPSLLANMATMLYNPNNVTPEAAPVTVEWEIEACNDLLEMLGFRPPPEPPEEFFEDERDEYQRQLRDEFGWSHITSGGTAANIEALWVARNIRYFALSIKEVVKQQGLALSLKRPSGKSVAITRCSNRNLLLIKPNEAIYLLARFVEVVKKETGLDADKAATLAMEWISESKYSLSKGFFEAAAKYPPVILTSGAAHYSIQKAAEVIGIGRQNVEKVEMDHMFRMKATDLSARLESLVDEGRIPIAVVAMAGTTEEGAVDPIHEIAAVRARLEKERNLSFWLHIDGAWAGFFRSVFRMSDADAFDTVLERISSMTTVKYRGERREWLESLLRKEMFRHTELDDTEENKISQTIEWLESSLAQEDPSEYYRNLHRFFARNLSHTEAGKLKLDQFEVTTDDRISIVQDRVSQEIDLELGRYKKTIQLQYGAKDVLRSFLAFPQAESITVDPHKMGYTTYPCGVVAFRNDRVRHFVTQEAPYITAASHNALVHHPPKHVVYKESGTDDPRIWVDAFAPFTLEGSRPGFSAASLWLSSKLIPFNLDGHGKIIRASILGARELFEWIKHWPKIARLNDRDDGDFELFSLTHYPPDTNIVVFCVKRSSSRSLRAANELTELVYKRFSIQAELGERQYSYSQPFFLTSTTLQVKNYPYATVERILNKMDIREPLNSYSEDGLVVLRATVMSPYISSLRERNSHSVLRDFMLELVRSIRESLKELHS